MSFSANIKRYQKENEKLKQEIEEKAGKTAEQLYEEREKRIRDVIDLKVPDRIPLTTRVDIQKYTGVSNSATYYDPIVYKRAARQIAVDFQPDVSNIGLPMSGAALAALDVKNRLWPGGPLPPDYDMQFVEGEWMKADEYDIFLNDPSDFVMRCYLPRMYGALAPLAKLPPIGNLFQGFDGLTPTLISPEFIKMAKNIAKAGEETVKFREAIGDSGEELAQLGFPPLAHLGGGGIGGAPFDVVSSFLRGMKGSMLDMFQRPEKLLKLCDLILNMRIAHATPADPKQRGNPKRSGMPLWRGDKKFMSQQMFEKFYWPGLKKALQATIDVGFIPVPFFEAEFGERLERLLELPKGKVVASVEYVDAFKANDILKGHACIFVRPPLASKVWTLRQVEECTKDLITKCRKGGGLIVEVRMPDKGTKEDYHNMMESIREYARY
ncbi:MAG: hypothetical protein PHG35_04100 [Dehalococcoidales bacterium]|nr:hypothetical protein [Dehalococcoidales bacterium]